MSKDDRTLNKDWEKRILSKTVLSSKGKESVELWKIISKKKDLFKERKRL